MVVTSEGHVTNWTLARARDASLKAGWSLGGSVWVCGPISPRSDVNVQMSEAVGKKDERHLFVEGWEFMQTLGEGAYGE